MSFPADHLTALSHSIETVRDGNADAIHDMRVATRRVREALPLLRTQSDEHTEELRLIFRKVGRALGRARDGDVALSLLDQMEQRRPAVGTAAAAMRRDIERQRQAKRRKLVKVVESTDFHEAVADLLRQVVSHGWRAMLQRRPFKRGWEGLLRQRITDRAAMLRGRIDRAGGVYFPKRVHAVRIAAKKLRYALEIADETGLCHSGDAIEVLKETQDTLGYVHDCHLLVAGLAELDSDEGTDCNTRDLLVEALEGDVQEFHRRYLSQRNRLRQLADAAEAAAAKIPEGGHLTAGLVVATTLIVPLTLLVLNGARRPAGDSKPTALGALGRFNGDVTRVKHVRHMRSLP
jgi:CHAD domain-containing protein